MKRFLSVVVALCLLLSCGVAEEGERVYVFSKELMDSIIEDTGHNPFVLGERDYNAYDMNKAKAKACPEVEDIFDALDLAYSRMPESVALLLPDKYDSPLEVFLEGKDPDSGVTLRENAKRMSIELVYGDIRILYSMMVFCEEGNDVSFCIGSTLLPEAAETSETVFLITAESDHFFYQGEKAILQMLQFATQEEEREPSSEKFIYTEEELAAAWPDKGTYPYKIGKNDSNFDLRKTRADECWAVDSFFATPYYISGRLPRYVSKMSSSRSSFYHLSLKKENWKPGETLREDAIKFRVELISGDIRLGNVFEIQEWSDGGISIYIDYNQLQTVTSETYAIFQFTVETEHLVYQERKELRILDFQKNPPFPDLHPVTLRFDVGETIESSKLREIMLYERNQIDYNVISSIEQMTNNLFEGQEGIQLIPEINSYTINCPGTYSGIMDFRYANLEIHLPLTIDALEYHIIGETSLIPGKEYYYMISDPANRHFTWSVKGEGAEIDPETGKLTVTAQAGEAGNFTVVATPDEGVSAILEVQIRQEEYQGDPIYLAGNTRLDEFDFSKKVLKDLPEENGLFKTTWYAVDALPDGVKTVSDNSYLSLMLGRSGNLGDNFPVKYALEFVSGERQLADAVTFYKDLGKGVYLEINHEKLKVPGRATFRITLENAKYIYQQEKTVTVDSFLRNPPFMASDVPAVVYLDEGQAVSGDALFKTLFSVIQINGNPKDAIIYYSKFKYGSYYWNHFLDDDPEIGKTKGGYYLPEEGIYDFSIPIKYANVQFALQCRLISAKEELYGNTLVAPGESSQFMAVGGTNVHYTWNVQGKGASIDTSSGLLTVDKNTLPRTVLMVTATPDNGGIPLCANVVVGKIGFSTALLGEYVFDFSGIQMPVLSGKGWEVSKGEGNLQWQSKAVDPTGLLHQSLVYFYRYQQFFYDEESVESYYRNVAPSGMEYESREIRIDGAPAMLYTFRFGDSESGVNMYMGQIDYVRNNIAVQMILASGRGNNDSIDNDEPITLDYLEEVASNIHYDEAKAPITCNDVRLTVEPDKNAAPVLVFGKKLQLKASFGNPDKVNKKKGNDEILWSITDAEGGETTAATVTDKGLVTAAKDIEQPMTVLVAAVSETYGTKETMEITVIPVATALTVDPAEINLYEGSEKTETVRAVVVPDTIPSDLLSWTMAKEGFAEMTATEDGSMSFKALKAGKTTATVSEPGGKKATLKVNVFLPVEDVELQVTGKQVPGGTVTVKATIAPKNAGKKDLEWSLDVGEDIATVNNKGQVKIAKTAPAGTVITVTCRALGAPEPVVKTVSFEIADK